MDAKRQQLQDKVNAMMDISFGCAESFVAAVGEYLWGGVDDQIQMISTGFSGGVGGTHEELCGGVSGAAMIIGLLYGRTTADEAKMIRCKRLIATHRDRFIEKFGDTRCQALRDAEFGSDERNPCSAIIAPAAFMLLDILEEEAAREDAQAQMTAPAAQVPSLTAFQKEFATADPSTLLAQLEQRELPHEHRAWIGDRLAEMGDSRPGVGVRPDGLPDILWLPVAGGEVEVERAGRFQANDFYIGQYPVTFQQYQIFLDAPDGFQNSVWWEGLEANEVHRAQPGEQRFPISNHPRENVSWFDAMAFGRWFTARLKSLSPNAISDPALRRIVQWIREDDWEVRLPAEWEWQLAATGGDPANRFPWGPEWDEGLAHTKHNQLNRTMSVGMYPQGAAPNGALDMSGNVWEWCLNAYEKPVPVMLSGNERRVLRGGSWYHWGSYAHNNMRSRYFPDHRYNAGGFRLVCGPPITT